MLLRCCFLCRSNITPHQIRSAHNNNKPLLYCSLSCLNKSTTATNLLHVPITKPWTNSFVCPTEIIAFSEAIERFSGLKTAVLACSCDSEFSHLAWVNTPRNQGGLGEMKIPIIADFTKKIATDYGVLKEDEGVAYRGLFIIDPKQVVRQITINDLPVGRNVDEVVRLVEAFQFTDEVCYIFFLFLFFFVCVFVCGFFFDVSPGRSNS
jgi:alkyl hydroperoxide reductase subunit AhpC